MNRKTSKGCAFRIGLLINPVAGLGGSVGLKGSDGAPIQKEALARGAQSVAQHRAEQMLRILVEASPRPLQVVTASDVMGENATHAVNIDAQVVHILDASNDFPSSTQHDTRKTVEIFDSLDVDVIVFVGGDGTARDVHAALESVSSARPVLGVPAGVKMHSGVFARSAPEAAALLSEWLPSGQETFLAEVADIDEKARRNDILRSNLYGYLNVPFGRRRTQGGKMGSSILPQSLAGLAEECSNQIDPEAICLLGPGSTVRAIATRFKGTSSLLGVDAIHRGQIIGSDLSANQIHELTNSKRIQLVISPIGGQGFLLGRGNQQLDSHLLERLEPSDFLIVCTEEKLAQLGGGPLYMDVDNSAHLEKLTGYKRVITGYRQTASVRLIDTQRI